MEVIHERCCGLDVHKKSVVACCITPKGKEVRTFGAMIDDLSELECWIKEHGCTAVAMESTGVYWKPIYNVLEMDNIQLMVVNAQHIKAVPGRKTDVKDAEWIADLLRHGLLRGSFIPTKEQRQLRDIVRYRRSMIDERSREVNRVQKILETANLKLSSVATDIMGVSGRAMLNAIIEGTDDPKLLAALAKGKLRSKIEALEKAFKGFVDDHVRLMLSAQLEHIGQQDETIAKLDAEIKRRMLPFKEDLEILDSITGVGQRSAEEILAEIGTDMERFPSDAHIGSWSGMCPGQNESAGKRKSGKTRKGNKHLRGTLVEASRSAARSKNTYLSAQYHRIAARRGANRAAVAVGHSILIIAYHLLKTRQMYKDLGALYFDQRKEQKVIKNAIRKLESLGLQVTITKDPVLPDVVNQ